MKHHVEGLAYLLIGMAICVGLMLFLLSSLNRPHTTIPANKKTSQH